MSAVLNDGIVCFFLRHIHSNIESIYESQTDEQSSKGFKKVIKR